MNTIMHALAENFGAFIALLGALGSAIITSLISRSQQSQNFQEERKKELYIRNFEQYMNVLELVVRIQHTLQDLGNSISGRYEPEPQDYSAEAKEMRRRDEAGARAIATFASMDRDLESARLKMLACGSADIADAVEKCHLIVTSYFVVAFHEDYPRFIASKFNKMLSEYREAETELAKSVDHHLKA